MPLYEYRCTRGHQFEVTHTVGGTVKRCEQCGSPVRRVFSPVGIIFKGSGFHINDYRKTPAPKDGDAKSTPTPVPAASSTSGGDGKSATTNTASAGTKSS